MIVLIKEYGGLAKITGPFVILQGVSDVAYEEIAEITIGNGNKRKGRVVKAEKDLAIVQVFEGTKEMSLTNTKTRFLGKPLELPMSKDILGRVFNGIGRPIDGGGEIYSEKKYNVNGEPINPVARKYPRNFIQTGISAIDGLMTLIRGQKLPIFSGNGLPHDAIAAQIVRQAKISEGETGKFAIVFAAMGVKHDVAEFFRKSFEESGVLQNVVMYLNLADDPAVERIVTPRAALTAAEYLAFREGMHILVILTDMTNYAEALREISSARGEVPSRRGYPGYLYSDLASLYERAGMLDDRKGSITQIPILSMPNDDITHPIPDLTGFITEGQIVLSRALHKMGIYPPINVLPSLSRLMKDGIGEGFTRDDHPSVANQLFTAYSKVQDIKALSSVIGEDELSESDRRYLEFGKRFEDKFIRQSPNSNRSIEETLSIGWEILSILNKEELDRISNDLIEKYYKGDK